MPNAGTTVSPSESIRRRNSSERLENWRSGSSVIPANNGRRKRSIILEENPYSSSRASAVVSFCVKRRQTRVCERDYGTSGWPRLSRRLPMGASSVPSASPGEWNGSPTRWKVSPTRTNAPESNGQRSRGVVIEHARRVRRGRRKGLKAAVEAETVDDVGAHPSTRAVALLEDQWLMTFVAETGRRARPARPAPITTTSWDVIACPFAKVSLTPRYRHHAWWSRLVAWQVCDEFLSTSTSWRYMGSDLLETATRRTESYVQPLFDDPYPGGW